MGCCGTTDPRDEVLGVGVVAGMVIFVGEVRWLDCVGEGAGLLRRAVCGVLTCGASFRPGPTSSTLSRLRFAR